MAKSIEDYREMEMIINQQNPWGNNDPDDMELAFDEEMNLEMQE